MSSKNVSFSPLASNAQKSNEEIRSEYFANCVGGNLEKVYSFLRFARRQDVAKIFAYKEIFDVTSGLVGSIADCGVFFGQGLMTYAHMAVSLEPYNYQCKIYGFDTFAGDSELADYDRGVEAVDRTEWRYAASVYEDLQEAIKIFDADRPLSHLEKIKLVRGDLTESAQSFVEDNPEVLFRIVHLSVNLYHPTKAVLDHFYPRLVRGGAVAVHGLNLSAIGSQRAIFDFTNENGVKTPEIRTVSYYPNVCYFIKD